MGGARLGTSPSWEHPHFGILWSDDGFSFPFLPSPSKEINCPGMWYHPSNSHMGEWIYPLSGRENNTAIKKQTAERLSNLPNIKDLVAGRTLQLKKFTWSQLNAFPLYPSFSLQLTLRGNVPPSIRLASPRITPVSCRICACLFLALLRTDQEEKIRNKNSWLFLKGGKMEKNPLWDKR